MKIFIRLLFVLLLGSASVWADEVRVQATGQAPAELAGARAAAIEDALRRCVEAGGGVDLVSMTETRDFTLVSDVILSRTAGYVRRYEVLQENPNQDGLYTVRVEALIARGDVNADAMAFRSLIERKGRPKVLVVGSVDGDLFDSRLTAQIGGELNGRGLHVVAGDRLNYEKQKQAHRAAVMDGNPGAAALIAEESGAHYLVVVDIQGEQLHPRTVYGVQQYPVDAVGIVRVIAVGTAQLVGSGDVETRSSSDTPERAERQATTDVTLAALNKAIGQVASHWLDDVDARVGGEVAVAFQGMAFDRLSGLVRDLQRVNGIKSVLVDQAGSQGRSLVRVVTTASAMDVGIAIQQIDPSLDVRSEASQLVVTQGSAESGAAFGGLSPVMITAIGAVIFVAVVGLVLVFKRRPAA